MTGLSALYARKEKEDTATIRGSFVVLRVHCETVARRDHASYREPVRSPAHRSPPLSAIDPCSENAASSSRLSIDRLSSRLSIVCICMSHRIG